MTEKLQDQVVAHFQSWSVLPQSERTRSLKLHIGKNDKVLFAKLRRSPTVISKMTKRIQAAWLGKPFRSMPVSQLERFMPQITATYIRNGGNMLLERWINQVLLEQCTTVAELEAFLKQ